MEGTHKAEALQQTPRMEREAEANNNDIILSTWGLDMFSSLFGILWSLKKHVNIIISFPVSGLYMHVWHYS